MHSYGKQLRCTKYLNFFTTEKRKSTSSEQRSINNVSMNFCFTYKHTIKEKDC